MLTLEQIRCAAGIFNDFNAALQFTQRVVKDFAVFFGDGMNYPVGIAFNQLLELKHHPRTFERRCVAPRRKSIRGGANG